MLLGSSYYPERWDKTDWEQDAKLMQNAGLTFIRTGEFAWSKFELSEGAFDFTWMDEALNVFAAYGIKVILCTPTAAPPPWLTNKHPDILPVMDDATRFVPGERRHYCFNSPVYREYSRKITEAMAKHYAAHPSILGWQIDNELGGEEFICHCDICRDAFQHWLKERYKTAEELNRRWGGTFFSFEFNDFSEVNVPMGHNLKFFNPSFRKDYLLFCSDSMKSYLYEQRDTIKAYTSKNIPVTTNRFTLFWGENWFDHIMDAQLDVVAFDNYDHEPALNAFHHDFYRSVKPDTPHWVLEQSANDLGIWDDVQDIRRQTIQSAQKGAELCCYFSWRQIYYGAEQDLNGVVNSDGEPGEAYEIIRDTARWLKANAHTLAPPKAELGLGYSYGSSLSFHANNAFGHVHYIDEMYKTFYCAAFESDISMDFVRDFDNLSDYKAIALPMYIEQDSDPEALDKLEEYIKNGGILLLTGDFWLKTRDNHRIKGDQLRRIEEFLGIRRDLFLLTPPDKPAIAEMRGAKHELRGFFNRFSVREDAGVTVLAKLSEPTHHAGVPALIERIIGTGRLLLFAGMPDKAFYKAALERIRG